MAERFDVPASIGDTNEQLRWKAAQADVVRQIKAVHEMQKRGTNSEKRINPRMED